MFKNLYFYNSQKGYIFSSIGLLLSIYPISFLVGSLIVNLNTLAIGILFIIYSVKNKKTYYLKNNLFLLLLIFWTSFLVNLYFSINFENSIIRTFGFLRFVLLFFAIKLYFENCDNNQRNFVNIIWLITIFVISFDLIYEFIFGYNTLGFTSYMPGRLASFLNDELKIGNIYSAIFLICAVTLFYKSKSIFYTYLFIFFALFISLIIGERSNFIRVLLMTIFFIIFFEDKKYIKKLLILSVVILFTFSFINLNKEYEKRFYGQFLNPILKYKNPINAINNTVYGANYDRAIKIFNEHKIFGIGIKNFRIESGKSKYQNKNLRFNEQGASTHPHQIHFEILSETGLFGYCFFLILYLGSVFISAKNFFKTRNLYVLASLLYFLFALIPFLPSGSFFTTYGATLLWINFGLMSINKNYST